MTNNVPSFVSERWIDLNTPMGHMLRASPSYPWMLENQWESVEDGQGPYIDRI